MPAFFLRFSESAFTLLELLVVIGIIGTVFVVAIPNINSFNNSQKLTDDASKLLSNLRVAQSNAASGLKCGSASQYLANDWHIRFINTNSYAVEPTCATLPNTPSSVISLSSGVAFDNICQSQVAGLIVGFSNVLATPILPSACLPNSAVVTLKSNGQTMTVTVQNGGAVYVSSP